MMNIPGYKLAIIIAIELLLALVHALRIGTLLDGRWYELYYSYFSDIVLPFGWYFLLCLSEASYRILGHWSRKAVIILALMTIAETLQYFGIYAFGTTFDPVDYVMYGLGVLLAVFVDRQVFARVFDFWTVIYHVD